MRLFFAVAMLSASLAVAEEKPVEIPLKEVWGVGIEGARDIKELDPGKGNVRYGPTTQSIVDSLQPGQVKAAGPGFAVSGVDLQALRATQAVFTLKQKPPKVVSGSITLVFYGLTGPCIELDGIEREGNNIKIKWHFVSATVLEPFRHFALVPLFDLEPGKYEVRIERQPSEATPLTRPLVGEQAEKMAKKYVCKPFHFEVK